MIIPLNTHYILYEGTFRDPRQLQNLFPAMSAGGHLAGIETETALTGQLFMVNAHRSDRLHVPHDKAQLRLWRDTAIGHASPTKSTAAEDKAAADTAAVETAGGARNKKHPAKQLLLDPSQALWRQRLAVSSQTSYTSAPGLLGYEWDVFVDDLSRPPGAFPLSHSDYYIQRSLLQDFGAAYRGSGNVVHQLSLYRHYSRQALADLHMAGFRSGVNSTAVAAALKAVVGLLRDKTPSADISSSDQPSRIPNRTNSNSDSAAAALRHEKQQHLRESFCAAMGISFLQQQPQQQKQKRQTMTPLHLRSGENRASSLVFGAGTVQWTWGLSTWHDADYAFEEDHTIQQATANLLADMGALPGLRTGAGLPGRAFNTAEKQGAAGRHGTRHYRHNIAAANNMTPTTTAGAVEAGGKKFQKQQAHVWGYPKGQGRIDKLSAAVRVRRFAPKVWRQRERLDQSEWEESARSRLQLQQSPLRQQQSERRQKSQRMLQETSVNTGRGSGRGSGKRGKEGDAAISNQAWQHAIQQRDKARKHAQQQISRGVNPFGLRAAMGNKAKLAEGLQGMSVIYPSRNTDFEAPRSTILSATVQWKRSPSFQLQRRHTPHRSSSSSTGSRLGRKFQDRRASSVPDGKEWRAAMHEQQPGWHRTRQLSSHASHVEADIIRIHGTARDADGGRVSAVEVSMNGGRTWHLAVGTDTWLYVHHFNRSMDVALRRGRSPGIGPGEEALNYGNYTDRYFCQHSYAHSHGGRNGIGNGPSGNGPGGPGNSGGLEQEHVRAADEVGSLLAEYRAHLVRSHQMYDAAYPCRAAAISPNVQVLIPSRTRRNLLSHRDSSSPGSSTSSTSTSNSTNADRAVSSAHVPPGRPATSANAVLQVMSRAVDDSGWREESGHFSTLAAALCAVEPAGAADPTSADATVTSDTTGTVGEAVSSISVAAGASIPQNRLRQLSHVRGKVDSPPPGTSRFAPGSDGGSRSGSRIRRGRNDLLLTRITPNAVNIPVILLLS